MYNTWENVEESFHLINHTSRASKNLSLWGDILSSAYMIDREKANAMWQQIVSINVSANDTYAKYFVVQIFRHILEKLPPETAVEFLLMDTTRFDYLFKYGESEYGGRLVYCVIGQCIINKDYDYVDKGLSLLNHNKEVPFYEDGFVSSWVTTCVNRTAHGAALHLARFNNVPKDTDVSFFKECMSRYKDTTLGLYAEVSLLLHYGIPETRRERIDCLLDFCLVHRFRLEGFLYLERDYLEEDVIYSYLCKYCEIERSLPMEREVDDSIEAREYSDWFFHFFCKIDQLRNIVMYNQDGLTYAKAAYLNMLLKERDFKQFAEIIINMFDNETLNDPNTCLYYFNMCLQYVLANGDVDIEYDFELDNQFNPYPEFGLLPIIEQYDCNEKNEFLSTLAEIYNNSTDSANYDELVDSIQNTALELTGSLAVLSDNGFVFQEYQV